MAPVRRTPVLLDAEVGAIAIALAALCISGCSFSYSSDSSSDSSENSSDSSVDSSDSTKDHDHDHSRFERDVESYTLAYLEGGGAADESFLSGLGDLSREHGISDWEASPGVWEAVERALARSSVDAAERDAYRAAWIRDDAASPNAVAKSAAAIQ